jgi:hypothetical protein
MDQIEKLIELVNAAATTLKYPAAIDTERGAAQVELIIAATGLDEASDSWIIQAIEDRINSVKYQDDYRASMDKLKGLLPA